MKKYTYSNQDLMKMQARPLETKIQVSAAKFLEFCQKTNWNVSLSFSGGADSSVLFDMFAKHWSIHRDQHHDSPLIVIYANTSNEFASMPSHVKSFCKYIEQKYNIQVDLHIARGKVTYFDVVRTDGYPVASKKIARMVRDVRTYFKAHDIHYSDIENYLDRGMETAEYFRSLNFPHSVVLYLSGYTSKNELCKTWCIPKKWRCLIDAPFDVSEKCCSYLKKQPIRLVDKEVNTNPIYGTLAEDSQIRKEAYLKTGCNAFKTSGRSKSTPMGFWTRQDVLRYLYEFNIPIAPPYGEIVLHENGKYEFTKEHNTGCKLCLFGCHLEHEPNRIQRLAELEPATYRFAMKDRSEGGLGYREIMEYLNIPYENKKEETDETSNKTDVGCCCDCHLDPINYNNSFKSE